ncbi:MULTISPECIES: 16S rRNA (cytidine(1402)-2'-O)-methyltransferase [unclassified Fusibacter]|uniref:16S rRNA (cytidine(1402)-2'-O)-methyltransferase n=1 Tax=unclassified Fusibacter TaxID=2624464 RepID=UPI00101138F0|nr:MULTISPECIES: 16S rRNA (cytidine(1402)-2'-O)-methyltransferase [unclassified Fusibacter]MCK8059219.1 16S rRNA (cytidine(1402)-2'-O)-methyltransferase [Fusibacter sp. A2]RXV62580.1 16S rRNA (cytidine(1402)-2'-O)-methyltransferase [Fusibacter sp. A1]
MLYICPTPIGNLGDMTYRAVETLKSVDEIACEDTRVTVKLLNHFEIKKHLFSYHEHNEKAMTEKIIEKLRSGMDIALVSDAGMPGISDPGEELIKACIRENIEYTVLPGASAAVTAVIASNMQTQPFHYEGFLDRQRRKKHLEKLKGITATLVFYESPHRILKALEDMLEVLGDRNITLGRELTKKYETYFHTTVSEAIRHYEQTPPKGEFVVVVEGYKEIKEEMTLEEAIDEVHKRVLGGERQKEVVKELAKVYGVDRQELYKATANQER